MEKEIKLIDGSGMYFSIKDTEEEKELILEIGEISDSENALSIAVTHDAAKEIVDEINRLIARK